jgi:hypothetical protein
MTLPLPHLDTRRFADLADEARAEIPRRAPVWTDFNLSDPGITLTELVAAELDRLMYAVDRVTDRDRRTLLRLLGFAPRPPQPASGVASFVLGAAAARVVSAGTEIVVRDPGGADVSLRTQSDLRAGLARIAAIQVADGAATVDCTRAVLDGRPIEPLGPDPDPARGSSLLIGLDRAPDAGFPLSLWLACGWTEDAARLVAEHGAGADRTHHSAQTAWEAWDGASWNAIAGVIDGTRALTHDGAVVSPITVALPLVAFGAVATPCAWLRCRLIGGRHDVAPRLTGIALHAVAVTQQQAPIGTFAPSPGSPVPDAVVIGRGDRSPHQRLVLPGAPIVAETVAVWAMRGASGVAVSLLPSLDACGPDELVATLDAQTGTLVFGDGRRGRMLAGNERVLARYDCTLARAGNLRPAAAGAVDPLLDVQLPFGASGGADAEAVVHAAGRAASLLLAHERLLELVSPDGPATLDLLDPDVVSARPAPERALNGPDLERVVLDAVGCRIARARAFPELDPAIPGLRAAGTATVVVVPGLPAGRPTPTAGLLAATRRVIERRRIVGSRIVVAPPSYVVVAVHATLSALPGVAASAVADAARAALDAYLDPVVGGPFGRGWPFGRDVYRADVMARLDAAVGVDNVVSLDLVGPDGVTCGNVCVPDTALAAPGDHVLEVIVP